MMAMVCVAGLGAALLMAMAHAWWTARGFRQRARRELQRSMPAGSGNGPLRAGPVTLVGRIAGEAGTILGQPLTVEIEQSGTEEVREGWVSHRWVESTRTISARPFRLLLEGGQSVRVEPGEDVVLVGPEERLELLAEAPGVVRRRRTASIPAGTPVHVRGHLRPSLDPAAAGSSGYRDPGSALVLAGGPGDPLVCSTSSLQARLAERAEWYRSTAVLFAILLGITQLGVYGRFHALGIAGRQVKAADVQMSVRKASRRSRFVEFTSRGWLVDGSARHRLQDRVQFDEVPRPRTLSTYTILPALPAVHVLGERPRISLHLFFWISLLCGSLILGHLRRAFREDRERPWYQHGPLVEEGTGPLGVVAAGRDLDPRPAGEAT